MAKTRVTIARERKITIIYCRENHIYDIVNTLRNFNDSTLWNKRKYEWSLEEWQEYFNLKTITNALKI